VLLLDMAEVGLVLAVPVSQQWQASLPAASPGLEQCPE